MNKDNHLIVERNFSTIASWAKLFKVNITEWVRNILSFTNRFVEFLHQLIQLFLSIDDNQ